MTGSFCLCQTLGADLLFVFSVVDTFVSCLDLCSDETDNSPLLQPHTLKEFEQHLNDLKKENFSLKLRIYFLEERIQQKYEESSEDVYRTVSRKSTGNPVFILLKYFKLGPRYTEFNCVLCHTLEFLC
uniref:Centrosomin N-terminal motif 1 domain-containing protein n=1 Tax=Oryzias melastigma TaxID=30732 RepID=A0A3B3DXL4_ORYME